MHGHKIGKRLLDSSCLFFCLSVLPSIRMEGLGSNWTDIYEIGYSCIFRNTIDKFQVSLKYDKHKGYFIEDQYTFIIISCLFLLRMKNVPKKLYRKSKLIFYVQ